MSARTIGPPLGGFLLGLTPTGLWITAAAVCLVASVPRPRWSGAVAAPARAG